MYFPDTNTGCSLPDLPRNRIAHTQIGKLACGGGTNGRGYAEYTKNCVEWNSGTGEWKESHTMTGGKRDNHAAWETKNGVYLIGGAGDSGKTSELVKPDGTVTEGFPLKTSINYACPIPDQENNEVILTAGLGRDGNNVQVYDESGWKRDMPSLNTGRAGHGCTSFIQNGKKVSHNFHGIVRSLSIIL